MTPNVPSSISPGIAPTLTDFSLGLQGKIYGSAMPFGLYDPQGLLFQKMKAARVSSIVLLAEDAECREKTGRDLLLLYKQEGLRVISLPTANYGVPNNRSLSEALDQASEDATQGQNILIHCSAGLGRTAFFAAMLARQVLGLSGIDAIDWLKRCKPDALLTPPQILIILS